MRTTSGCRQHRGLSPFMASLGYQLPLFDHQEKEVVVPSVHVNFQCCKRIWIQVRATLLHSFFQVKRQADRCRVPELKYQPGQRVWLSSKDLLLQTESRKLAPQFVGPFEVNQLINLAVVHLKLRASLIIHLTFHVSLVKPVRECKLSLTAEDPSVPHRQSTGLHSLADLRSPSIGLRLALPL